MVKHFIDFLCGRICDFGYRHICAKEVERHKQGRFSSDQPEFDERWEWLRAHLIKHPTWRSGHRNLVDLAIEQRKVDWAYGSAIAMQKLSRSGAECAEADFYLARSLLAAGDYSRALLSVEAALREEQVVSERLKWQMHSCRGAALLAAGRTDDAYAALSLIPASFRDPGDELVLRSLERRRLEDKPTVIVNIER